LVERNTGKLIYPSWQRVSDFRDTPESFVIVPIHGPELHKALVDKVEMLRSEGFDEKYTGDVEHLRKGWDVPIPFLPVMAKEEFNLFSRLVLQMGGFVADDMALEWIKNVDGKKKFLKLPAQLRMYYKSWERITRIKEAAEKMQNDAGLLQEFLNKTVPMEVEARRLQAIAETGVTEEGTGHETANSRTIEKRYNRMI
jgi:hypothetical protein